MKKKIFALFLAAAAVSLHADTVSEAKLKEISRIIRWEFGRVKNPSRPQIKGVYGSTGDPKIKNTVYGKVRKICVPFETKVRIVGISTKRRRELNHSIAARFPYKTPEQIAVGAVKESHKEYPLVKVGDEVTIRYYRNNIYSQKSGKIQDIRDDYNTFLLNDQLIHLSEIQESDRKYFNPRLNRFARDRFITYYRNNYAKIKKNYTNRVFANELSKVEVNEKNGYIFYNNSWRTAKYVTDQMLVKYKRLTDQQLATEKKTFWRRSAPPPPKKK